MEKVNIKKEIFYILEILLIMINMEKENYSLTNIIILEISKEMDFMDMEELNYMILVFMRENLRIKKLLDMEFSNILMEIFMKVK